MAEVYKVALITGAASGIGKAITAECLKNDIKVGIVDINTKLGEQTCIEFQKVYGSQKVIFVKCDVTVDKEFEDAFKIVANKLGKINIVINNSGVWRSDTIEKLIDINLMGVIRGTKLGISHMSKETGGNGGLIINMSSQSGFDYTSACPEYSATKFGVLGYSMCVAMDTNVLTKHGIRINVICPGPVETPLFKEIRIEKNLGAYFVTIPPEYIAGGALHIIKDESKNATIMLIQEEHKYRILKQSVTVVETILPDEE